MRHSTLRSRKLLVLPLLALALLAGTVDAHAAAPAMIQGRTAAWTGNSGATLCTGPPIFSNFSQPGNCAYSGTGTGLFHGQFTTPATLPDPTQCPKQAVDPTDVICGHFGMDFNNVQGSVTVGILLNPDNDLDLCVIDSAGTIVNNCSLGSGATESVTFNVKCTDTRYEAQILPISYGFDAPTPTAPANYTGNATGSLAKCFPGGSEGQGNGKRQNFNNRGKGHGNGKNGNNHDDEHVSSDVEKENDDSRGKVRYTQPKHASRIYATRTAATDVYTDGCDLRSTTITSTTWNDLTQTMVVSGYGTVNGLGNVPFVFTETDNGTGTSDTYSVDSTCQGQGNLTEGSDFTHTQQSLLAPLAAPVSVVPFGLANSFAVLAGSAITNTGPTTIFGDLGTFPTPTITGIPSLTINGTNHGGDAVTQAAKTDLVTAYDAAAGLASTSTIGTADIGGKTLTPGIYTSGSSIGLTGTVTLDAGGNPNAVFVFQAGSTLTTASASKVVLINGAQSCNVFWQVGSSATLGTYSSLRGSILALTSITVTTGVTVDGRVLARNGAVTLDSNVITKPTCA
jgi:hypothetical protein